MGRVISSILMVSFAVACSDDGSPARDGAPVDGGPQADQRADTALRDIGAAPDRLPADVGPRDVGADRADEGAPAPDATADGSGLCDEVFGSASISGSVGGVTLEASYAAAMEVNLGALGYDVSFYARQKSCANYTPFSPSVLWLMSCNASAGTYDIGESCGGGASVVNQAGIPSSAGETKATAGTITIETYDVPCGSSVRGSFDLSFGDERVTGRFDTLSCGTMAP